MKKYLVSLLLVSVLMISTLGGCGFIRLGSDSGNENDELQAQIEALQSELDALNAATEEETEEVTEEETEEVTEAETKNDAPAGNTEVSADWATYTFSANGKTLTLPCTYPELKEATGFTMKSADEKSYLESGYYGLVNLYDAEENLMLYIEVSNDTDADATYADCMVTSVSQTAYQVEQGASVITFPGGLQVGQAMTTDELEAIFGAPDDTYEYIDNDDPEYPYEKYEWTYAEDPDWTTHNCFEVAILNGVIDQISLEHLYYE